MRDANRGEQDDDPLQVGCKTGADAALFGGRVDTDKDEICLLNALVDVGREMEISAPRPTNDVFQAGLVNGKTIVGAVPSIYAGLIEVNDGDLDIGTFESNNGTRRSSYTRKYGSCCLPPRLMLTNVTCTNWTPCVISATWAMTTR